MVPAVAATCVLLLVAFTAVASAATIEVTPGPNAINKALDRAHDGDTLRIHDGTYRETLTVDKRVTLRGVGGRPQIDARCKSRLATKITHGGVTLDHLKVVGAAENPSGQFPSEVDFEFVPSGIVHDVVVHDSCGGEGAEYGINVFNSGPIYVTGNRATGGFSDAGIYIGGITDTGGSALRVLNNTTYRNHQGIIVENSSGGVIQVAHNSVHDNVIAGDQLRATGIFINNSDRVRIWNNAVKDNGHFGINLGAGSDHNRLFNNVITGNRVDIQNNDATNCGAGNTYSTTAGPPLSNCG